jgi:hypothetical protein
MMNEHTKLLIMKAGGIICSTEATGHIDKIDYLHFDAEKFAELLVKECATIDFTEKSKGNFNALQTNWISNIIIEHFEDEE